MEEFKHKNFGKRLRQIRREKGLSQEKLAELLKVSSNSYVSDIERGRLFPTDERLKDWADIVGLTWEDIEELKVDAELERLGLTDPGFTMMFKEVPHMNTAEKQSLITAFERVMKARKARGYKE